MPHENKSDFVAGAASGGNSADFVALEGLRLPTRANQKEQIYNKSIYIYIEQLDDGWPESETCNCPALSKRCTEREKERVDVKE